ncbi:NUDIX hydrolase [bacterium]|nr:NUDIX hydrolase [bacterium]
MDIREKAYCAYCGGLLSLGNIDDRERLFCRSCGAVIYENPVPAVALIYITDDNRILLAKRNVEPEKGKWCLPGGFIENDEAPEEAALREFKEETGLDATLSSLIGVRIQDGKIYKRVLIIVFLVNEIHGFLKSGDDVDEVRFFPLDQLPEIPFEIHSYYIDEQKKIRGL